MTIPTKKLMNGFKLPVLGLGTWGVGGLMTKDISDDKEDREGIQRAIAAGITHIDTAEIYAQGHAEELVGEAIKDFSREKLFITTKVKDHLGKEDVINAVQGSLKRLGTDYIDLYLVHAPNPAIPISETMEAFNKIIKQGLVKYIGVSNFTNEQFEEAQKYSQQRLVTNQIHYNLHNLEHEEIVTYCQRHDILATAYRSVDRGILTKIDTALIDTLCRKYHKTPAQVAINWLISQSHVVALSKMITKEHLEENLGAIGWKMDEADILSIKQSKI